MNKKSQFLAVLTIFIFLSGCIQQVGLKEYKCGNFLPKGYGCYTQKQINEMGLKELGNVTGGTSIELQNFTIIPTINSSRELIENVPQFFLVGLTEILFGPLRETFTKTILIPVELIMGGNISVEEIKLLPNVRVYTPSQGKKFVVAYLTFENKWNVTIRGNIEGALVTDKKVYYPTYLSNYDHVMSVAKIPENYTVWDFARYEVRPKDTGVGFLVFEVDEDETPVKFIFNTTYSLGPLFIRKYHLKNVVSLV